ncbi:MAG: XdhC/CoxI family protein [Actinomycetota bacterium]|nr:XdhC/CoxI family protein [Actinomycetota bacterium]
MTTVEPNQFLAALSAAAHARRPLVLATIVATEGSVPRHIGTKMIVYPDATIIGTVGGGKVEACVRDDALATLADGSPQLRRYTLHNPKRGDPGICGGIMTVYLEPYMPSPTIFVIGCGHIGKAVVDLAHWLGYYTVAVDDRADLLTEDALPNADVRFVGSVSEAVQEHPITADTSVVVVTRSHELDAQIVPTLVATQARYIGVMGSTRRWTSTRALLVQAGLPDGALDAIHVPIGIEIGAETVEEIAVSIMSDIIKSASASTR